jgi:hypothetical protein
MDSEKMKELIESAWILEMQGEDGFPEGFVFHISDNGGMDISPNIISAMVMSKEEALDLAAAGYDLRARNLLDDISCSEIGPQSLWAKVIGPLFLSTGAKVPGANGE